MLHHTVKQVLFVAVAIGGYTHDTLRKQYASCYIQSVSADAIHGHVVAPDNIEHRMCIISLWAAAAAANIHCCGDLCCCESLQLAYQQSASPGIKAPHSNNITGHTCLTATVCAAQQWCASCCPTVTSAVMFCRPVLLMGALRGERAAGPLAVMALVEAIAAVVCQPGVHTTDPIILSAMLQVSRRWSAPM